MLLTADLLLHFQRCSRRAYLDSYGDLTQRDPPSDYLLKLMHDGMVHRQSVLANHAWETPSFSPGDWESGATATLKLMHEGVDRIHHGVLLSQGPEGIQMLARPDLLLKVPGRSRWGDWLYIPMDIKLGKRPKLEYQTVAAFHAQVLAQVQEAWPEAAWLLLREKGTYKVDLSKLLPQTQAIIEDYLHTLAQPEAPEVFISRNRCSLCHWFNHCYGIAQAQHHLSLVPGVTERRYTQLLAHGITTVEQLATIPPEKLIHLSGFGPDTAHKLVIQAHALLTNQAIAKANPPLNLPQDLPSADIELYFDIEAEPELNLAYLLGVLVIDRRQNTQTFHALLAETPEDEPRIWEDFVALVTRYPQAPIFHFCPYEAQTVERLAKLYGSPPHFSQPLLSRFVDLHERVTRSVVLPVENYALKSIARWVGFEWRDTNANGAQAICWYADWLKTGDRTCLEAITSYNEDDCLAMYHLKDWLVQFVQQTTPIPVEENPAKI